MVQVDGESVQDCVAGVKYCGCGSGSLCCCQMDDDLGSSFSLPFELSVLSFGSLLALS